MTTALASRADAAVVEVTTLADGLVVRLAGVLEAADAQLLRDALLRPRPAACKDVLVDAGGVDGIALESLGVLAMAAELAGASGRRMAFTRMSEQLTAAAGKLGVLPRLQLLGPPRVPITL
jgi:anti-anti-sigma regulatory factor